MATNSPTIGRNGSAIIIAAGNRLDLQKVTSFHATPRYNTVASVPLNSPPVERYLSNGWDIVFAFDRYNSAGDDFATLLDNTFWSSQSVLTGTIYVTINNPDGTTTEHEYTDASFRFTSTGNYSGDSVVSYGLSAFAAQRKNV